jgi:hypothetical protein
MGDWYDELSEGGREYAYAYGSVLLCEAKKALDAGQRIPILEYMAMCVEFHLIAPEWLQKEFLRLYELGVEGKLSSWDKAFGRPKTSGWAARHARNLEEAQVVFDYVQRASLEEHRPINDCLFREIGEKIGCGATRVKQLYASERRQRRDLS